MLTMIKRVTFTPDSSAAVGAEILGYLSWWSSINIIRAFLCPLFSFVFSLPCKQRNCWLYWYSTSSLTRSVRLQTPSIYINSTGQSPGRTGEGFWITRRWHGIELPNIVARWLDSRPHHQPSRWPVCTCKLTDTHYPIGKQPNTIHISFTSNKMPWHTRKVRDT